MELPYLKEVNGVLKLKKSHSYHYQENGPLLPSDSKWVHLSVWCKNDHYLERIRSDNEILRAMKNKLETFYFELMIKKLETSQYEKGRVVQSAKWGEHVYTLGWVM